MAEEIISEQPTPKKVELTQEQFNSLMQRLNDVERQRPQGAQLSAQGNVTGIVEKYPVDPRKYPDPTEDLYELKDPILVRHNLRENYVLTWKVKKLRYQTAAGIWINEPSFSLTLYRKHFDEETGEPTGKLFKIQEGRWTEDEVLAHEIARKVGIDTDAIGISQLLERVRKERFREWLVELFRPANRPQSKRSKKEEVHNGVVMEVTDIQTVRGGKI